MGPSIWQLIIVLVIVLLLFGTKKLKNIGGDLGGAIKSFRGAMKTGSDKTAEADKLEDASSAVIESEVPASKESTERN